MPAPDLPLELCEGIIDFHQDDTDSLRAYSLTCRAWAHRARRYLFRKIQLSRKRHCLRFLAVLESSAEAGTRIGDYVIDLEFPRMGLTGRRREASLRCALLANLARHVPNLESLRMYDFDWTGLVLAMETAGMMNPVHASEAPGGARPARESGSAAHSIPYFPQLKSLHISSCASSIIATGEAVVRFLAAFPQLYALDIAFMPTMEASRSVYPPDRAMAQAWGADASPCVRIHELRLDTSTWAASPALDWLARPMVELDLHKLDIDLFCPWEPTSRLAELLYGRECAMLEDLAFSVSHEDVLRLLDLSKYRYLRSICMRSYSRGPLAPQPLTALLTSFAGSQLKELRLIVQVYHAMREGNARELADWDALNNAILFLGRRCPKLVVVLDCEFDFVPPTDNFKRYTARCMRDRFAPTLAAKHLDARLMADGVRYYAS